MVFDEDQNLETVALHCIAQSKGALRRFHLIIGRQSREIWEAIAMANPMLQEVEIKYSLDDEGDFSAGGQRAGEMYTFIVYVEAQSFKMPAKGVPFQKLRNCGVRFRALPDHEFHFI